MRRRIPLTLIATVAAAGIAVTALASTASAADVTSLPGKVTVNARDTVFVTLDTPYTDPETGEPTGVCTDTWTTRVLGASRVILPIAAADCDGTSTYWGIGTRKGLKPRTTAIVEFTRTGADGQVISVQRLTITVVVPKRPASTSHSSGTSNGMCDPKKDLFCTAVAGSM